MFQSERNAECFTFCYRQMDLAASPLGVGSMKINAGKITWVDLERYMSVLFLTNTTFRSREDRFIIPLGIRTLMQNNALFR